MSQGDVLDRDDYVASVLRLYLEMPETPLRVGPSDRQRAAELYDRQVPMLTVESALLLASLRRLGRPQDYPRLTPIRSLAYFMPVVEELLESPLPDGYIDYVSDKVRKLGADNFKSTQAGARSKKYVSS